VLPILQKIHEPGEFCPTIKDVRKWHGVLNEAVFDGVVPKFYDIVIVDKLPRQFAATMALKDKKVPDKRFARLEINPRFPSFKKFIIILIHEMIHCWQWICENRMDHGKTFFQWKEKLKDQGIPLSEKYHRKFLDIPE